MKRRNKKLIAAMEKCIDVQGETIRALREEVAMLRLSQPHETHVVNNNSYPRKVEIETDRGGLDNPARVAQLVMDKITEDKQNAACGEMGLAIITAAKDLPEIAPDAQVD